MQQVSSARLSAALFVVNGAVWAWIAVSSAEFVLGWAAVASFLSAVSLLYQAWGPVRRALGVATCLLGVLVALFQAYLGASLTGTPMRGPAVTSLGVFVLLTVLQLFLLYRSARAGNQSSAEP